MQIASGIDVSGVLEELAYHPELWDANGLRKQRDGTPHSGMSDIWVRYNDLARLDPADPRAFNNEHVPVWYPSWNVLQYLHPIVFDLMATVDGEMLGGVLITRIPPGEGIAVHRDDGWHVEYYDKFYLSLKSAPGANFVCEHDGEIETLCPQVGEIWRFDNRKTHWVENKSSQDRITAIICIRTNKFKEENND